MIIDGRTVPTDTNIDADLCIVGGGPAGIALALEFAGSNHTVCLLESGGKPQEPRTPDLADGENVGLPYFDLRETHANRLGGLSQVWGGWIRPMDPLDFEYRPWVDLSGWPLDYSGLEPYYRRAHRLCTEDPYQYDASELQHHVPELYRNPVAGPDFQPAVWHKLNPPTRFGDRFLSELADAANVEVYLHATALRLVPGDDARSIVRIEAASAPGRSFTVTAGQYVVAAGGFGSTRLLLASNIGGEAVGRYFMEHPHVAVGRLELTRSNNRPTMAAIDHGLRGSLARYALERPTGAIKSAYALTPDAQRRLEALSISLHLRGFSRPVPAPAVHLAAGLRQPIKTFRDMPLTGEFGALTQGASFLKTLPTTVAAGYERLLKRPDTLEIFAQAEQSPNPSSSLTLLNERDPAGMRKLRLDWRLNDLDKHSLKVALETLDRELRMARVGSVIPYDWVKEDATDWGPDISGGHHQLGTTRMSTSPRHGVVDENLRVHGVENLYVAGPSTLPTGGISNPMLTILALALRLGDHLGDVLVPRPPSLHSQADGDAHPGR